MLSLSRLAMSFESKAQNKALHIVFICIFILLYVHPFVNFCRLIAYFGFLENYLQKIYKI